MAESISGFSMASATTAASSSNVAKHNTCKFCKRSQRSPNPYVDRDRFPGDFLPWRREQGRECRSCCNFIKCAKLDKVALESALEATEEMAKFMQNLTNYETLQNSPGGATRLKRGRGAWAVNGEQHDFMMGKKSKEGKVAQVMSSKLQTKMCLGNLWPSSVYKAHFKREAEKRKIATVRHQGQILRGVILDPSHGLAIGVVELTSIGEKGADVRVTYDDAEDEVRPGQLADAWKQMESSCAVTAYANKRAVKADGTNDDTIPQTATLKIPSKRKLNASDTDSDADLLGEVWGEETLSQKPTHDEEDPASQKIPRPKAKATPLKKDPGSPGSAARPRLSVTGQKGAVKRAKDLASAEQAILAGKQFVSMLENRTTVSSVSMKALELTRKKVTEKLTANWISIFTADFDPQHQASTGEDEGGVTFLKELKVLESKLQSATGFVELMNADSKKAQGGVSLRLAAEEARTAGINLPHTVDEIALVREMKQLLAQNSFTAYKDLLSASPASGCEGVNTLPEAERQSFQEKCISRDLCNLMRPDGQVELTLAFLKEMVCCHFINTDLKSDLEKFAMIFEPTEHDFEEVKKIKSDIQTTPTHRFHKMLTLFPTGCAVAEACAKYEQVLATDRGFALELQTLKAQATDLQSMEPKHLKATNECILVASQPGLLKKFGDFREGLVKITSSCSGRFQTTHAGDLATCQAKLDTVKTSLLQWADTNTANKVEKAIDAVIAASKDHGPNAKSEKAEATLVQTLVGKLNTAIDDGFKTADYLGLHQWMPPEEVQDYSNRMDTLKNVMSLVKGAMETYIGGYGNHLPFNFEDPDFVAWMDWVGQVAGEVSPKSRPTNCNTIQTTKHISYVWKISVKAEARFQVLEADYEFR